MSLEIENQRLKQRLAALTREAAKNDVLLKRSLEREMDLLEAKSLQKLLDLLVHGLTDSHELETVTLALCDRDHRIRHLLTGEDSATDFRGVFFVDSLEELTPRLAALATPWLGKYKANAHQAIFPNAKGLASIALIPLIRHDRLVGSLNFGSADPTRFTREHATDFLSRLGAIASFCLENAVNRARLIRRGLTDALTGWYNRRYLEDRIQGELARARRNQQPLSCLILDIDHFKSVNDSYGHLAGDAVLRAISKRAAGELRASDVAARFGGDEFAVLLPNTSTAEAQRLAERIRIAVSTAPIEVRTGVAVEFTLSIGIACLIPERDANDFPQLRQRLLERADAALYRAKSAGRNRVALNPETKGPDSTENRGPSSTSR